MPKRNGKSKTLRLKNTVSIEVEIDLARHTYTCTKSTQIKSQKTFILLCKLNWVSNGFCDSYPYSHSHFHSVRHINTHIFTKNGAAHMHTHIRIRTRTQIFGLNVSWKATTEEKTISTIENGNKWMICVLWSVIMWNASHRKMNIWSVRQRWMVWKHTWNRDSMQFTSIRTNFIWRKKI